MGIFGYEIPFDFIIRILSEWGYLIVFALAFLETSAFIGLLVPGETTVLLAGAAASEGYLDPWTLGGIVIVAALLGDTTGYLLGRHFGRDFLLRHQRLFRLSRDRLEQADRYFARHGGKTIFVGRWVGFLRSLAPFLAGSAHMPYPRFLAYDVLGAASWGAALTVLGYLAGRSYRLVEQWLGRISLFLVLFVLAAGLFWLLGRYLWRRRELLGALAGSVTDEALGHPLSRRVYSRFGDQIDWLVRRFSPREAYGLTLTLGLAASALLAWSFGVLTDAVLSRGPFDLPDRRVATLLHEHAVPELTSVMNVLTRLGSGWLLIPASVVLGLLLVYRGRRYEALIFFTAAPGAALLAQGLKLLIHRERPDFIEPLVSAGGYAFPSGHATNAMAFYLVLAVLLSGWVRRWETRVYVLLGALAVIVLVGFSRLYLGVHYLTDVLAGYAVGALWATLAITAATVLERARGGAEEAEPYPQGHVTMSPPARPGEGGLGPANPSQREGDALADLRDPQQMSESEIQEELSSLEEELEELAHERRLTLGGTGVHLGGKEAERLRAEFERDERRVLKRIEELRGAL